MALLEELFIGSARGARGEKSEVAIEWDFVRNLGEDDVPELLNPASFEGPKAVNRLRERHHYLARLLAQGSTGIEASIMTGYSQSYISMLSHDDPAFMELVEHYKQQAEGKYLEIHERLGMLGTSAVEELQTRLDEKPESLTVGQLQEIAEMALDRSIAPAKGASAKLGTNGSAQGIALNITFQTPAPFKGTVIEGKRAENGTTSLLIEDDS